MSRARAFRELLLARIREIVRVPEIVFWSVGFPIVLAVALGIAFRHKPIERLRVAIEDAPGAEQLTRALAASPRLEAETFAPAECASRLRLGRVALVVAPGPPLQYRYDLARENGALARALVDDALQRAAGRRDVLEAADRPVTETGGRLIDFLLPGLLGMSLLTSGMWTVGAALIDLRVRKVLKRFLATPMRKAELLGATLSALVLVSFVQAGVLLAFGVVAFDLEIRGSLLAALALVLVGAFSFSGLGLLVVSRVRTNEGASGLINLVMTPMLMLSGVFFATDLFPAPLQAFAEALPLTAFNDALRAVILEGADFASQWARLGVLAAWGVGSFLLAGRLFRWT